MIQDIHHVAIICSDYACSRHFYTEILQLPVIAETYREERQSYKLDLQVGRHGQIELFSFSDAPPRPSYPEAQGLRHLAFAVLSVEEAVQRLNKQGVATEPIRMDPVTGKLFTFFHDPDGLPLELYEA